MLCDTVDEPDLQTCFVKRVITLVELFFVEPASQSLVRQETQQSCRDTLCELGSARETKNPCFNAQTEIDRRVWDSHSWWTASPIQLDSVKSFGWWVVEVFVY